MARKRSKKESGPVTPRSLLGLESLPPLPPIALLCGNADFYKKEILRRFVKELTSQGTPEVQRFEGPPSERQIDELPLSTVLDELRTPSFFAARKLVVVEGANNFLKAHRDVLESYVERGFPVGHLVLLIDGKADLRTRFARAVASTGWLVDCPQPYDRPPPWETRKPVWDSELSHWLVGRARARDLSIDLPTAFALHDRLGADLEVLDEELEKISTYLVEEGSRTITVETISRVTGELREDSIFRLVDLVLEGRRREAVISKEKLFKRGYHTDTGALVLEPAGIALPFFGAMTRRLRALRRAHAMNAAGARSEDWIREGLVKMPFRDRFRRQIAATPPERVRRLLSRLYKVDRSIKRGGDARRLVLLLVLE